MIFKKKMVNECFSAPGIIFECDCTILIGIHIILHKKWGKKEMFQYDFGDKRFIDFPLYWVRFSSRSPKYFGWSNIFRVFYGKGSCFTHGYTKTFKPLMMVNNIPA